MWVVDLDIKGFFDNIDHTLLLRALDKHNDHRWVTLYIKRWLTASVQHKDGTLEQRTKGTPQGGVISPLLANLFLHYVLDAWMGRKYPDIPFERYTYCDKKATSGLQSGSASGENSANLLQR